MITRTTISLDSNALKKLQTMVIQEQCRSLSQMINTIVDQFIESYEKKKTHEKMAKDYEKYAKKTPSSAFSEIEQAALTDLLTRKP